MKNILLICLIILTISFSQENKTHTGTKTTFNKSVKEFLVSPLGITLLVGTNLYALHEGCTNPKLVAGITTLMFLYAPSAGTTSMNTNHLIIYSSTFLPMIVYNVFYAPDNRREEVFQTNIGLLASGYIIGHLLANTFFPKEDVSLAVNSNRFSLMYTF